MGLVDKFEVSFVFKRAKRAKVDKALEFNKKYLR